MRWLLVAWFGMLGLGGTYVYSKTIKNTATTKSALKSPVKESASKGPIALIQEVISGYVLSARSEANMLGVHPDLKRVVRRALELTPFDFGITSGKRTASEQYALFKKGASQLDGYSRKSRHQTGHAIDYVVYDENGEVTWGFSYYEQVSWAFKQAAREVNVPIKWGSDWVTLKDGPHIELDRAAYP